MHWEALTSQSSFYRISHAPQVLASTWDFAFLEVTLISATPTQARAVDVLVIASGVASVGQARL